MSKIPRIRLRSEEELKLIKDYREGKLPLNVDESTFIKECQEQGINPEKVTQYWYKGKHYSIFVKEKTLSAVEFTNNLIDAIAEHTPKYEKIKYSLPKEPHCLVIDPADIHIGKLAVAAHTGDEYNTEVAVKRVMEGVDGILHKASAIEIDKIILVVGNDVMHVDSTFNTTTKGTRQDVDGMWQDMFTTALNMYVSLIEKLRMVAKVEVVFNPSNHDYHSGWALAQVVKAWFKDDKCVEVDASIKHRKYTTYGNSLIGTSHGDGAKADDLPMLMATECAKMWAECDYKYWYLHHIHHKRGVKYVTVNDKIGVTIEYLRSPSGSDAWHSMKGYTGAPKAIEAFIHSKENGQVQRITHYFTNKKL